VEIEVYKIDILRERVKDPSNERLHNGFLYSILMKEEITLEPDLPTTKET
jgi:hypothetical protein